VAVYSQRGVHGQVVHKLAIQILSGRIDQGQVLDLAALEDELGVSRTVLRESLKVLTAKGLVDARQKRGTYVRSRSDWNLLDADMLRWQASEPPNLVILSDLTEVREIIEPESAALAAQRRSDEDLGLLSEALDAMRSAVTTGDGAAAVSADLAFHRSLLAATHNELLQRLDMVIASGLADRDRLVHGAPSAQSPVPSHQAVFDAIADADADAAKDRMRSLLIQARRDFEALAGPDPRVTKSRRSP
jgi:GntR family galactonate operon transcriptional repressor